MRITLLKYFIFWATLSFSASLYSQPSVSWVDLYNNGSIDAPISRAIDSDAAGNVYTTGLSYISGTSDIEAITIKYDPDGNILWIRRLSDSEYHSFQPNLMSVDNAGNVFVSGFTTQSSLSEIFTVKYDTNGNQEWLQFYNQGKGDNIVNSMVLDADSNVYLAGQTYASDTTAIDYLLVKYKFTGQQAWDYTYDANPGNELIDEANRIVVDNVGDVYLTGYSQSANYGLANYITTIKVKSNGTTAWSQTYNSNMGFGKEQGFDLTFDTNGDLIVVGATSPLYASGVQNILIIKYDSQGNQLWLQTQDIDVIDDAYSVSTDATNNIYVTGASQDANGSSQSITTVKMAADGTEVWKHKFLANNSPQVALGGFENQIDLDGNIYVAGYSSSNTNIGTSQDYLILKYNPNGILFWTHRFGNALVESPTYRGQHLVVDDTGDVYTTNTLYADEQFYMATAKLSEIVASNSAPLHVSLFSFDGWAEIGRNLLNWKLSEQNMLAYTIERSKDGSIFKAIKTVETQGNTNAVHLYTCLDNAPFERSFYRLKMIQLNGTVTYSSVIVIDNTTLAPVIDIYPNPATDYFYVQGVDLANVSLQIYTTNGKLLMNQRLQDGQPISLTTFPSGVYILKLITTEKIFIQRLLVRKA